jgi:chorismate mutase
MTELDEIKYRLERIENLITKLMHEASDHDEAKDALENIEEEIIARACRNGVCED